MDLKCEVIMKNIQILLITLLGMGSLAHQAAYAAALSKTEAQVAQTAQKDEDGAFRDICAKYSNFERLSAHYQKAIVASVKALPSHLNKETIDSYIQRSILFFRHGAPESGQTMMQCFNRLRDNLIKEQQAQQESPCPVGILQFLDQSRAATVAVQKPLDPKSELAVHPTPRPISAAVIAASQAGALQAQISQAPHAKVKKKNKKKKPSAASQIQEQKGQTAKEIMLPLLTKILDEVKYDLNDEVMSEICEALLVAKNNGAPGFTTLAHKVIEYCASLVEDDVQIHSLLPLYARYNSIDKVKAMIDDPSALEVQDCYYRTALIAAIEGGHAELIDLLLKEGADAAARNADGKNIVDVARIHHQNHLIPVLTKAFEEHKAKTPQVKKAQAEGARKQLEAAEVKQQAAQNKKTKKKKKKKKPSAVAQQQQAAEQARIQELEREKREKAEEEQKQARIKDMQEKEAKKGADEEAAQKRREENRQKAYEAREAERQRKEKLQKEREESERQHKEALALQQQAAQEKKKRDKQAQLAAQQELLRQQQLAHQQREKELQEQRKRMQAEQEEKIRKEHLAKQEKEAQKKMRLERKRLQREADLAQKAAKAKEEELRKQQERKRMEAQQAEQAAIKQAELARQQQEPASATFARLNLAQAAQQVPLAQQTAPDELQKALARIKLLEEQVSQLAQEKAQAAQAQRRAPIIVPGQGRTEEEQKRHEECVLKAYNADLPAVAKLLDSGVPVDCINLDTCYNSTPLLATMLGALDRFEKTQVKQDSAVQLMEYLLLNASSIIK
jgi:hypothetical protein